MIKNFFNVAGADAVKRIAEWIRTKFYTKTQADDLLDDKVDKVNGKGLSTEDYTTAEKNKLSNIEAGAEVNVQSDWNESDNTKDDYIKNKPTLRQPSTDGTSGQYLKSNGSGNAPSWETMDSSPTENSTKAVTSGGVKTALDGKQASISISTNANTPTDNDTVIMQDNGNTGTTSFLRRKLSTLWEYFKKKPYGEAYLVWGGKNHNANLSPIDANLISEARANRLARYPIQYMKIEDSRDDGVTWTENTNISDVAKHVLVTDCEGNASGIRIGGSDASHVADEHCKTRITFTTHTGSSSVLYARIEKICLWIETNGTTGNTCTVLGRLQTDVEADNDVWATLGGPATLGGWSDWNVIQTDFTTYGNQNQKSTQYGQFRLLFECTGHDSVATRVGLGIQKIRAYGMRCWTAKNSLASYNSFFDVDSSDNVTFPANVKASKHITDGGTASQMVLGNGTLQSLPLPINKGGTGATTAIGAEYNILNQVADISTALSDTRKIALCNQTKSASNGVFRWIALSSVWTWIKTHFDSSPTSGSGNGITSGGVYSALEEKVNLQPDFTVSQIDYSAGNVGKWQKVLRFPEGADLVINMKKTAMGSDATSTLWFSSSSMGDSYTSLFGNHSVRFVHDGGYVFLVLACRKSTNEPIESYTFQIAHSSVPMSDIVAVTDASPITATPKEPSIVYRAPMTTGAVSFNVNSSGAGSVAMANHNDFLGNMTSEASNGVVVTMSGATEGQIYRFVFTRNITGGVTFKQSNVAYCTISGDVNAGDTITLTAVSNTADGWLYEQESAGIKSTDGSVNVEYDGGVADLSVETPTIWNKSEFFRDEKVFEIGDGAISVRRTSDNDRPYVTMFSTTLLKFYVNNDTSVYYTYYPVTAGNTYHVKAVNYSTPDSELDITATQDGYLFYLDVGAANMIAYDSVECYYMSGSNFAMATLSMSFHTDTSTHSYAIITMQQTLAENLIALLLFVKRSNLNPSIAFGYSTSAKGEESIAVGQYAKADARQSLALGFLARALKDGSIAIGHNSAAFGLNGIAIGDGSRGYYSSNIAIGLNATTDKQYSVAIGSYAEGKKENSIAIGFTAKTNESNTIAIGALSFAGGYNSVAIGNRAWTERNSSVAIGQDTQAGMSSNSDDRPYLNVKEFKAVQFTDGGDSVMAKICETTEDVTISVGGNDYTLTPPAENGTLVVVNDAYVQYLYRLLSGYIKINGVAGYYAGNSTGADLPFEQLTGNYYAVWLRLAGSYTTPITSLSFIASYTDTNVGDYQVAVGSNLQSFRDSCVAVGHFLMSTRAYQTVIGSGNIPDYDALFIVGAGGNVTNARKNILTVDYREQLQVKGVRTQVARMTTSGTITGVNNIYLIGSGCTVALPSTGEEGQVLKVCAEGNCTVGGVSLEAGKFREYVCAGGAWYTRE